MVRSNEGGGVTTGGRSSCCCCARSRHAPTVAVEEGIL